jgi:hypothetical protein
VGLGLALTLLGGCLSAYRVTDITPGTLTPTIRWVALDPTVALRGDDPDFVNRIQSVSYDFRIVRTDDRRIVYERRGILDAEHRVGGGLEPGVTYAVLVRPRYHLGFEQRVGDWYTRGAAGDIRTGQLPRMLVPYQKFTTPAAERR